MRRVLIVDDEPLIRESMRDVVDWTSLGLEVAGCAANGLEALDLIKKVPVDIMITDIKMPYLDGLALMEELSCKNQSIATIILSGYDDFEYAQRAIRYGVINYLLKPVKLDELYKTLRDILSRLGSPSGDVGVTPGELERFQLQHQKQMQVLRQRICESVCSCSPVRGVCVDFCDLFEGNGYSHSLLVRAIFRCVYYVADEAAKQTGEDLNEVVNLREVQSLSNQTSFLDLRRLFTEIILSIAQQVSECQTASQRQAIRFVLQTIHREYAKPKLNLKDLAEAYGYYAKLS